MRATLNIPDDLLSEVQRISKEKSKTRAIVVAMETYVRDRRMVELRALQGNLYLDYDWRKEEASELQAEDARGKCLEK